jgi:hypothetical protein
MKNILSFRQYLKSPSSYEDLKKIIQEKNNYFSDEFPVVVAICGENPREFLKQNDLMDEVVLYEYAPWEESAARVAEVYQKSRKYLEKVQVIHYNEKPLGLTYPLELMIHIANLFDSDHLAVSDSDFQMPYEEIRKAYDYHLSVAGKEEAVITFPRREHRSLDTKSYPINRWAMEDLENLYIYLLSDLKVLKHKADFQSGLGITNRKANANLNFDHVGSWIGNLHVAIQVIHHQGRLENDFLVKTVEQKGSTINFDVQCRKIDQLYQYYLIPLANIILLALDHPERFLMDDWTKNKSYEEIAEDIYKIEELYNQFKKNELNNIQ